MRKLICDIENFFKENFKFYIFLIIISLFYGLVFTISDFYDTPFLGFFDFAIVYAQWFLVVIATFGLLYLLAINRIIFAILFPLFTAVSAALAYFKFTANVSFNVLILDSVLDNDFRTSLDLISLSLCSFFFLSLFFSIAAVIYRFRKIKKTFAMVHVLIATIILLTTNHLFFSFKRAVSERIPFTILYTAQKFLEEKKDVAEVKESISKGSISKADSLVVICILGESLRSDHLGVNGYLRNTTPLLQKAGVISYPRVYSEYTHTNRSLPHLLTRADSIYPERAFKECSFIEIFTAVGYHTSWLANQEPADTYDFALKDANECFYANRGQSVYNYNKWLDGDLLPYLDKMLIKNYSKQLIVMHTIGSHWWYNSHFPDSFIQFSPIVKSKIISSCTQQEMINSYDNTILYSDFFFDQVINRVKNKTSIVIYLSDHGEALGEDNQWLHAHDHNTLHKSACFVWMSPSYKEKFKNKFDSAIRNSSKNWRTDFLFHTMLGAGEISSPYKIEDFDILNKK